MQGWICFRSSFPCAFPFGFQIEMHICHMSNNLGRNESPQKAFRIHEFCLPPLPTHTWPGPSPPLLCQVTPGGEDTISEVKGQQPHVTSSTWMFVKRDRDKDHHQRTAEEKHSGNQGLHLSALVRAQQRGNKREKCAAISKTVGCEWAFDAQSY